jgi:hypothetical protein
LPGQQSIHFSYENPDTLLINLENALVDFKLEEEYKLCVDEEKYKVKLIHIKTETELGLKITRVGEEDYFAVECNRKHGDYMEYLKMFNKTTAWIENEEPVEEEELEEDDS